jgi:hypothetical protein
VGVSASSVAACIACVVVTAACYRNCNSREIVKNALMSGSANAG